MNATPINRLLSELYQTTGEHVRPSGDGWQSRCHERRIHRLGTYPSVQKAFRWDGRRPDEKLRPAAACRYLGT